MEKKLLVNVSYLNVYDENGMLNFEIDYSKEGVGGCIGDELNFYEVKRLANCLLDWLVAHPRSKVLEELEEKIRLHHPPDVE